MTPILAGLVDIDLRSFVMTCIFALVGAGILTIYFVLRRLSKRQWIIGILAYLCLVLLFLWFTNK